MVGWSGHRVNRAGKRWADKGARDRGKGLVDRDLPASPEASAKAIQRARESWQITKVPRMVRP